MKLLCEVYRSPRRQEMYLYVERGRLDAVPEALRERFGEPQLVMLLPLSAERRLARVDASEVIDSIRAQGFYLQMPPGPEALRREGNAGD